LAFRSEQIRQSILFFQKRKSEVARYFLHESQVNPKHPVRFKQTSDFKFAGINHGKSLAQPALTTQIQQLERVLGSSLFQRSNRLSGLTAAGLVLLPEARAIVERAETLPGIVERAARGETGRLRLGVVPPAATNRLAECLRTISLELPDMDLTVRQGGQDDLTNELIQHGLDLVIGRPIPEKRSGLSQLHLFSEQHGIIIRQGDPLAKLKVVPLKKLDGKTLLLLRGNAYFGRFLMSYAGTHGVRFKPVHGAEDFPSLHWMVRAGLGVAPCSLLLAEGLPRGLVCKPLRPAPQTLSIHAIWRGTRPEPCADRLIKKLLYAFR
jgi:DNA-binding transcriptional LysR family regulator